jgi:cyanate permease
MVRLILGIGESVAYPACGKILASLLWLLPWLYWRPRDHYISDGQTKASLEGVLEVLKERSAWGTCLGLFCANFLLYLLLTWLPFYLVHERHFSAADLLGCQPAEVMMVAAHPNDLKASHACGLRTAFV